MKRKWYIGDICVVVLACLVMAGGLLPIFGQAGGQAQVYLRGELYATLPLDKEAEITVQGRYNSIITVKNQGVSFSSSSCPNQTCVYTGVISRGGQSAVCTANQVVVKVLKNKYVDVVVG